MAGVAQDRLVEFLILGNDARGTVGSLRFLAAGTRHFFQAVAIFQQADRRGGHGVHIADGKSRPVTPSWISSGTPPTLVPMVGTSQAIASSAASPKDSSSLGISIRSAAGNSWFT